MHYSFNEKVIVLLELLTSLTITDQYISMSEHFDPITRLFIPIYVH